MPDPCPSPPPRRVLLVDRLREALADELTRRRPDLSLRQRDRSAVHQDDLIWADTYVGFGPPAPPLDLGAVSWVHAIGAGVDAFLFRKPFPRRTLLTRTQEAFGPSIGEYCLAQALAATQRLADRAEAQRNRRWSTTPAEPLRGTRAIVLGTGEVGRGVARALAAAEVVVEGISRRGRPVAPFARVGSIADLGEAVRRADWLVLAAPLTEATWRVVDSTILQAAQGAYLINVGRGGLLDEAALLDALAAGRLRGASLDVFEREPLPEDSPLWHGSGITITPHIAGVTTVAGAAEGFLAALAAVERGEVPPGLVDQAEGY